MTAGISETDRLADWVDLIAQSPLLGGLDKAVTSRLLELAELVQAEQGEVLIRQGDEGDCAYLVVEGDLDVVVETALGEVVVATLGPSQIVGEIAIFSQVPRTATVRARRPSSLLRLRAADLGVIVATYPQAALGLLSTLGRRVAALNRPLAMLTLAAQALEQGDFEIDAMSALFTEEDMGPFAQSLQRLVQEMEKKQSRRQEMLISARLQQSMLPRPLDFAAQGAPFVVEALMRPSREIGGDFYDFFFTEDGERAIFLVADVVGKGIQAALFMAVSRTVLRAAVSAASSIEIGIARANAQLAAENPECLFVTVFLLELNLADATLRYVNAGHCTGYVIRASGDFVAMKATGPMVAILPNPKFSCGSIQLESGDRVILVSDGVTEAHSPVDELFGDDRLVNMLGSLAKKSPVEVIKAVDQAVTTFAAGCEQFDDITCLTLAYS